MDPCGQEYATKIVLHIFPLMTLKHFSESYRSQGTTLQQQVAEKLVLPLRASTKTFFGTSTVVDAPE
jgi:hypothetical protein